MDDSDVPNSSESSKSDQSGFSLQSFKPFVKKHPRSLATLALYLIVIWVIAFVAQFSNDEKAVPELGIIPRTGRGLAGIVLTNICHLGVGHVALNTLGVLFLSYTLLYLGRGLREFVLCTLFVALVGGLFTWSVARFAVHCGVSGTLFGHLLYLLAVPAFERPFRWRSLGVALAAGALYGGLVLSIFSGDESVSWEGHLGGALAGLLWAAIYFFLSKKCGIDCATCGQSSYKRFREHRAEALYDVAAGEDELSRDDLKWLESAGTSDVAPTTIAAPEYAPAKSAAELAAADEQTQKNNNNNNNNNSSNADGELIDWSNFN